MRYLVVLIVSLIVFISCKRDTSIDFVGVPANLQVGISTSSGLNTTTADFNNNAKVYFNAVFNRPTYWTIKIKGLQSGGVKIFNGYGTKIDITNSSWLGTSDSLYFFRQGEKCVYTINISGLSVPIIDTVSVVSTRQLPIDHFLVIDDFEQINFPTPYAGDVLLDGTSFQMYPYVADTIHPIQGFYYAVFGGVLTGVAKGKYFLGGIYYQNDYQGNPVSLGNFKNGGSEKDSIFINLFAKSAPLPYSNSITYQITESDGDVWAFQTPVLTEQWQLYSVSYTNLSPGYQSAGNGIKEPNLMSKVNLGFVTAKIDGEAKAFVDFFVITYGKPFQP